MKGTEFPVVGVVVVHVRRGDVVVRGQQERTTGQLWAKAGGEQDVTVTEGNTHLFARSDLSLNLPAGAAVQVVGQVQDAVLRSLGDVTLETCHGDLAASEIGSLRVEADVHGDVALRSASGPIVMTRIHGDVALAAVKDVRIESIAGDASMNGAGDIVLGSVQGDFSAHQVASVQGREIGGSVSIDGVSGAVDLKHIEGDLAVTAPGSALAVDVKGDVGITGVLQPGGTYWINAGGDVRARIGGNVRVVVRGKGRIHAGSGVLVISQSDGAMEAQVGSAGGATALNIDAGGKVDLQGTASGGWLPNDAAGESVQQTVNQVHADVSQALAQAQEEMRRAVLTAGATQPDRRAEGLGASWRSLLRDLMDSLDPQARKTGRSDASTSPPDEVRTVLDMLAAGKITAEEAERLLEALRQ